MTPTQPLPLRQIFAVWLALGAQSFGGGAATLTMIQRAMIEQRAWMTDAEFVRDWALCQVAPGINLLCLTILIGRRLGGGPGIAVSLLGLLLPSVTLTVALTACYAHFQNLAVVKSAVRGVIPGTVGVGLLTAYQMTRPLLAISRREGRSMLVFAFLLLIGSGLVIALWHPAVVMVLCGSGFVSALVHWCRETRRERVP